MFITPRLRSLWLTIVILAATINPGVSVAGEVNLYSYREPQHIVVSKRCQRMPVAMLWLLGTGIHPANNSLTQSAWSRCEDIGRNAQWWRLRVWRVRLPRFAWQHLRHPLRVRGFVGDTRSNADHTPRDSNYRDMLNCQGIDERSHRYTQSAKKCGHQNACYFQRATDHAAAAVRVLLQEADR